LTFCFYWSIFEEGKNEPGGNQKEKKRGVHDGRKNGPGEIVPVGQGQAIVGKLCA
jgi:hypothetical protein